MKAGKKIYIIINDQETQSFLTRQDARDARVDGDLMLEVVLTSKQRKRLGNIIQSVLDNLITDQVRSSDNV